MVEKQSNTSMVEFYEFLNKICVNRQDGFTLNQLEVLKILNNSKYI